MQKAELSLIGTMDNGLSKWTMRLLAAIAYVLIWLAGLVMLLLLPTHIFEYSEGLADLSRAELVFLVLLLVLFRRHDRYCRHFATGFWRGISRVLLANGLVVLLFLVASGVWLALYGWASTLNPARSTLAPQLEAFLNNAGLLNVIFFFLVLVATYLAAPHRYAAVSNQTTSESAEQNWQPTPVSDDSPPETNP